MKKFIYLAWIFLVVACTNANDNLDTIGSNNHVNRLVASSGIRFTDAYLVPSDTAIATLSDFLKAINKITLFIY